MMDAGYQQLFYSAKCSVLWIHPNAVQVWMSPHGFLKNANVKSSPAVTAMGSKAAPVCVTASSPPNLRCLPKTQTLAHVIRKKGICAFKSSWSSVLSQPKGDFWEKTLTPTRPAHLRMRGGTSYESNSDKESLSQRWAQLFTVFTSVSKISPKLSVLVMFKQYVSVFLIWGCLILEHSVADK